MAESLPRFRFNGELVTLSDGQPITAPIMQLWIDKLLPPHLARRLQASGDADIAFHVTSALAASGQQAQALTRLRGLLGEHKQFNLRKDAEALLALLEKK